MDKINLENCHWIKVQQVRGKTTSPSEVTSVKLAPSGALSLTSLIVNISNPSPPVCVFDVDAGCDIPTTFLGRRWGQCRPVSHTGHKCITSAPEK